MHLGQRGLVYRAQLPIEGKKKGAGVLCRKPLPAVPIRHVSAWTDSARLALFEIDHPAEKAVF